MVTGELSFDSKALRLTDKGACLFSIGLSYCEKGQRGTIFATRRLESRAEKKRMKLSGKKWAINSQTVEWYNNSVTAVR